MEKQIFYINYSGSGIKTLRAVASILLFLNIIAVIIIIIIMYSSGYVNLFLAIIWGAVITLMSMLGYAICKGIACIAENNLYITTQLDIILEKSHNIAIDFEEMPDNLPKEEN